MVCKIIDWQKDMDKLVTYTKNLKVERRVKKNLWNNRSKQHTNIKIKNIHQHFLLILDISSFTIRRICNWQWLRGMQALAGQMPPIGSQKTSLLEISLHSLDRRMWLLGPDCRHSQPGLAYQIKCPPKLPERKNWPKIKI